MNGRRIMSGLKGRPQSSLSNEAGYGIDNLGRPFRPHFFDAIFPRPECLGFVLTSFQPVSDLQKFAVTRLNLAPLDAKSSDASTPDHGTIPCRLRVASIWLCDDFV